MVDIVVSPPLGACRQSVVRSSARRYCVDVPAGWVRFEAGSGIIFGGAWDEGGGRRHNTTKDLPEWETECVTRQ